MIMHSLVTWVQLLLVAAHLGTAASPPFYGQSALGHSSAARGWNSYVAQSNGQALTVGYVDSQCSFFYNNVEAGYDYICSFDSGWSVSCNGDDNGRILPDPTVFSTMSIEDFAAKLHSKGMKLGIYMIPGAFLSDANKTVAGTDIVIGSLFNTTIDGRTGISNNYNCRNDFIYSLNGVQEWHDSVVQQFASWGVDYVKLDYVTPGSSLGDDDGDDKPANDSGAVTAMHSAISRLAPGMRLDISWALDRQEPFFDIWKNGADALRVDQDINAGQNPVEWDVVQRTVEMFRQFVTLSKSTDPNPMMIRPDMDNLVVATNSSASNWAAFGSIERYAQLTLWLGAGANLIVGSDLSLVDDLGRLLLTHPEVLDAAAFTANWPMVPKLNDGSPSQLQAWVAGPNSNGAEVIVILSNLGPDLGQGGFNTTLNGTQSVDATLTELGIGGTKWNVRRVLGGGNGKTDFSDLGVVSGPGSVITASLAAHETVLLKLTKAI